MARRPTRLRLIPVPGLWSCHRRPCTPRSEYDDSGCRAKPLALNASNPAVARELAAFTLPYWALSSPVGSPRNRTAARDTTVRPLPQPHLSAAAALSPENASGPAASPAPLAAAREAAEGTLAVTLGLWVGSRVTRGKWVVMGVLFFRGRWLGEDAVAAAGSERAIQGCVDRGKALLGWPWTGK